MVSNMLLASGPRWGPADQRAGRGPIDMLETSTGLPSVPLMNQGPPEEPPVMVQPIRYMVGFLASIDRRVGLSVHCCCAAPSNGASAG